MKKNCRKPSRIQSLRWNEIVTSNWFLPLACVFLLIIVLALRLIADIDLGFHLRGGQWMLENHSFHRTDVYTYTVNQNEYIAMYWLYQILNYVLYTITGYAGLVILNALLIAFVFFLVFVRMKTAGIILTLSVLTILLAVLATEIRFSMRPEIMTWIFILLMLIVLDRYFHAGKNSLFMLVIIQVLWVNFHGLFVLGWAITGIYFVSHWVHTRRFDKTLLTWSVISVCASIINPYFLKGVAFPFYLFTRLQGTNIFRYAISELKSPWAISAAQNVSFFPTVSIYAYYLITFVGLVLILLSFRKRRLHEHLLFVAFFYLSYTAIRNVPLFVVVAIHIIALSLRDIGILYRTRLKKIRLPKILNTSLPICLVVVLLLFSARVVSNAYYLSSGRANEFGAGLSVYSHPTGAAEHMTQNNLHARMLNDLNTGSWLIWTVPQPVFIDGRLEVIQEEFFMHYLQSFSDGGLQKLTEQYNPRLIVFNFAVAIKWYNQLQNMPDWRLIYWDEKTVVYAHEDYAPEIPALQFLDVLHEKNVDTTMTDQEIWRTLRRPGVSKFARWLQGFFKKQTYPYDLPMKMGIFAHQNGEYRAAELCYTTFLQRSTYNWYEVYFNLGSLYYTSGDYEKMLYCYGRALEENPDNTLARKRVNQFRQP